MKSCSRERVWDGTMPGRACTRGVHYINYSQSNQGSVRETI
jgi:hypothetical protein